MNAYVIDRIYDAQGHTGNTYYFRIIEVETGLVYNAVTERLEVNPDRIDSSIAMPEDENSFGSFPVTIPAKLITGKRYDYVIYKQSGSTPANTDDVQKQKTFIHGSNFGF